MTEIPGKCQWCLRSEDEGGSLEWVETLKRWLCQFCLIALDAVE